MFPPDDSASAASSMEVTDRIASLEQRVQMQEDEIQLLKSALADVVRRLNVSEEQQAMGSRRGPTKGSTLRYCFPFYESSKCKFPPFALISHQALSEWRLFPSNLLLPLSCPRCPAPPGALSV